MPIPPRSSSKPKLSQTAKTLIVTAIITMVITVTMTLLSIASGGFASDMAGGERTWTLPIIIHLATVLPALFIGGAMLAMTKGTRLHKILGRIYVVLMVITASATIFIGDRGTGIAGTGFSPIHLFTLMTFTSLPYAVWAARKGKVKQHREAMQGTYIGLCIAGLFAMLPGRLLSDFLFFWS